MEPECTLLPEQEDCVMLDWLLGLILDLLGEDDPGFAGVPEPSGFAGVPEPNG